MDTNNIERALASIMKRISEAALRDDFNLVQSLTMKAAELRAIRDQYLSLESRLATLADGPETSDPSQMHRGDLRELVVPITQGMINQNLLTLTDAVRRRAIAVGEKLTIETSNGEQFETILLETGNKLQERGKIGKFYREFDVRAGDVLLFNEVKPGRWRLRKK